MLTVSDLHKSFLDSGVQVDVLRGVSLQLGRGESCALLGESGSGKSTLLHLIGGLEFIDKGEVWIDGLAVHQLTERQRLALRRQTVGMVFQNFHLIDTLNVWDNIHFVASLSASPTEVDATMLVKRLGLSHLLERFPDQLSGGQQQRVAIARALLAQPALLLADEPTGSLDEDNAERVIALLTELCREQGTALLLATHSQTVAGSLDRKLRLQHGILYG